MYQIIINEQPLDVLTGEQVTLSAINPFMLYDSVEGKHSTLPKIGFSLNNERAFNFMDLPQLADNSVVRYPCRHEWNGRILHEGTFVLTRASRKDGFAGTYVENLGEFFGDFQTRLLTECPFVFDTTPHSADGILFFDGDQPAYCYPTIINPDFYGGKVAAYSGRMNDSPAEGKVTPRVPLFFASYILSRIERLTGRYVEGTAKLHEALSRLLIFNVREQVDEFPNISQHLPDLPLSSHLLELYRRLFNQGLLFENNRLSFLNADALYEAAEILDWSDKLTATEAKVFEQTPRMQLSYTLDGADALMKDKPPLLADYTSSEDLSKGVQRIQSKYSTLLTDMDTGLAICKQQGITEVSGQKTNSFSPRVLFWNGVQAGVGVATARWENYSLYLNEANGIPQRFWRLTLANRLKQFYLEKGVLLDESDIATLDFRKKIYINGTVYFLVSVSINLSAKTESVALLVSC